MLHDTGELFRLAAQAGKMFAYEWDVATDAIVRSPEAAQILAIADGEPVSGHQILAKIHPDDRQRVKVVIAALTPEAPYLKISYRMLHPDGTVIWVERNSRAHFDERGTMLRVVGMVADITERKVAEEGLRTSEERLRLAQSVAGIGTFERDIRTGVNTWTADLESMYGLPPGGFGKTLAAFVDLIHPGDRAEVVKLVDGALRTGEPTSGEWRVIWPDGSVHWLAGRWRVLMDESGEPSRVVGVDMDVSERKQAEQALLVQKELLKTFVKNVPAAVAMLDCDMRYLQVSDRWCTDYLGGKRQILGRSHYELFPDMPERWKEIHRRALAGETLRADEDHWDAQDGSHWARWEVRPWTAVDGNVGGILILAEDITRRKEMEQTLSNMTRKLIEAQEQERARIGRELHDDICQRLALLAVEIGQIQERQNDLSPDTLNWMRGVARRTIELSSDVQSLSHDLHSSKLELLGVAGGMKSWCREFGSRRKMQIDFKSHDLPNLPQEISLCLLRVLQEAVNNADKHSGVKRVEVQLHEEPGAINLIVSDSGKGFDVAAVEQGDGLGLTSMRERVRLANGTIAIESKPMTGTTIHVRVPIVSNEIAHKLAG